MKSVIETAIRPLIRREPSPLDGPHRVARRVARRWRRRLFAGIAGREA